MNPYDELGIPRGARLEEARAALRRLSFEHHPDRGGNPARFKRLHEAYRLIEQGEAPAPVPAERLADEVADLYDSLGAAPLTRTVFRGLLKVGLFLRGQRDDK